MENFARLPLDPWYCGRCRSEQRGDRCADCGGVRAAVPIPAAPRERKSRGRLWGWIGSGILFGAVSLSFCAFVFIQNRKFRRPGTDGSSVFVEITDIQWVRSIDAEIHTVGQTTAFVDLVPNDALESSDAGSAPHHTEEVFDHFAYEPVEHREQTGTRTESYETTERCGEDCTIKEKTCKTTCTPKKSGGQTCKEECTGGSRRCTPKNCAISKTHDVPVMREYTSIDRVKKYRIVTRNMPRMTFAQWLWIPLPGGKDQHIGTVNAPPTWPTAPTATLSCPVLRDPPVVGDAGAPPLADAQPRKVPAAIAALCQQTGVGEVRENRREYIEITYKNEKSGAATTEQIPVEEARRYRVGAHYDLRWQKTLTDVAVEVPAR